ncbi:MAG: MFS transporter [Candidatus Thorarchaeota archaeon]
MSGKTQIARPIILSIALFSLAGQIAWAVENQYYNIFMYNVITPIPIYVSIMVALSTTVGTIATIIMGAFSDVKGKRKPLLLYGFIFWSITTAMFPLSAGFIPISTEFAIFIAILFDAIMTFFGAMALNAGLNAYITDVTNLNNRGKVTSIAQMMVMVALLIVNGVGGLLITVLGYYTFFFIVGGLVFVLGLIGNVLIQESPDLNALEIGTFSQIRKTFRKENLRGYKDFFIVLLVITTWQIGLNIFYPFLMIYLQHNIGMSIFTASILIFIALLSSIILAYPLGILTDKIGRKRMTLISAILFGISLFTFGFFTDIVMLLILGSIWATFYLGITISTFSWAKDLYPEENRGEFSGYWNLFSGTIPMVIGPLIGGWLATAFGIYKLIDANWGYVPTSIIFFVSGIVVLLTIIPLYFAKEARTN